ncbi:LPXTG cell wall anchor domain-containing protein [Micromonospora sp. AMSO12t]|uniref:DUF7507 domain-containing protein n=1 Tax=Micromonospora sp. AMSO12t TaxID=2650410 RepID=UPI00124B0AFE|nr:LPXTG cell wall anchor domain-containing protein [Micromonospora sp. AMSO12t]KAB1141491.1 LPXTG cell wall anchor domain-containing protein [Micromonospora sp. AMSO12t]
MSRTSITNGPARLCARLAAFAMLAGALLLGGSPALAAETININPGNVPTTAAQATQNCDPNLGGGPFANEDVWVFNLPGNQQTSGDFLSITATFSTPGGAVTRTIPTDPNSAIVNNLGTSKAWIRLPAGWTLTGASAVISGTADFFVLTHTCAASSPEVNPRLTLTKTGTPASGLQAGDEVTYTYTVTNQSTGTVNPITGITVNDNTVTGITCQATSLAPGASTTCTGTYTVTKADVANGKIVNIAQATGLFGEQLVPSNNATFTVTTQEAQASLSIDKKARVESDCRDKCEKDGFAAKGDKIFYTYRVANTGTVTITNVAVIDPTAGPVVCNNTTLAPGTSTDCHAVNPHVVTAADVKKGKVVNTARATGKFGSQTVTSDPVTVTVCIRHGKYDPRKHDKDKGGWDKDKDSWDKDKGGWDKDKDGKPHLPVTGVSSTQALSLGGGLLAAGALMVGASRLRRRETQA